jgi:predicted AlkP superfamily pyrophosphatase or phosphodiesterase
MLTGRHGNAHGLWKDTTKDVLIPDGMTIYEILRAKNPDMKIAHISGKCGNIGAQVYGNAIPELDVFRERCGGPGPYTPAEVATQAITLINEWAAEDFFIFAHFGEPDFSGHRHGVASAEYVAALETNDIQLGRLMNALPDGADMFVLSDHGFGTFYNGVPDAFKHGVHSSGTFFVEKGIFSPSRRFMDEWTPLWLSRFGVPFVP